MLLVFHSFSVYCRGESLIHINTLQPQGPRSDTGLFLHTQRGGCLVTTPIKINVEVIELHVGKIAADKLQDMFSNVVSEFYKVILKCVLKYQNLGTEKANLCFVDYKN